MKPIMGGFGAPNSKVQFNEIVIQLMKTDMDFSTAPNGVFI